MSHPLQESSGSHFCSSDRFVSAGWPPLPCKSPSIMDQDAQPPPGAWRRIPPNTFACDYEPNQRHPGYVVYMKVILLGHYNCNCHRSDNAEEVTLFLPHPVGQRFPVHFTTSGSWLAYAMAHGFGCPIPGFIVEGPRGICHGYLYWSEYFIPGSHLGE